MCILCILFFRAVTVPGQSAGGQWRILALFLHAGRKTLTVKERRWQAKVAKSSVQSFSPCECVDFNILIRDYYLFFRHGYLGNDMA